MARLLPHGDGRSGESRVGKVADRNGDMSWKAFAFPVDGGTAGWTEMKGQGVAAFGCPRPNRSLTGKRDLVAAKARLVADHGPGSALALKAVTQ